VVETVFRRLLQGFRLERERPRTLAGLLTRAAAAVALHNALIRWNRREGRPDLALEEVVGW
nr:IS982 family transposase [Chloroflexia bacterium]